MSFLDSRAEEFLEQGRFAYERGYYDLVMFDVEQFMQLKLKSLLFSFIGDYPRTHRLTQLFTEVMRLVNNKCGITDFYNGNREMTLLLEFATSPVGTCRLGLLRRMPRGHWLLRRGLMRWLGAYSRRFNARY